VELFVGDLDASVAFYTETLGFVVERRDAGYVSLRRGDVVLGLGPVAGLPEHGDGPGFSRDRLARAPRGLGVEIVLELAGRAEVAALHERCLAVVAEPLRERPWGLADFRLADPDGYYLRVTHRP
jgi:lactoylglutathione lyase